MLRREEGKIEDHAEQGRGAVVLLLGVLGAAAPLAPFFAYAGYLWALDTQARSGQLVALGVTAASVLFALAVAACSVRRTGRSLR